MPIAGAQDGQPAELLVSAQAPPTSSTVETPVGLRKKPQSSPSRSVFVLILLVHEQPFAGTLIAHTNNRFL